ncbi:hypothetical protein MPH_05967 [Macrophomina phaseolina MS6]|uniref:DUF6536 domain-containing protein n=1 Tax=Macrophomina phaseolina (strain MS6) TaxID=1126212 RepID=K2S2M9_MACPH|nr:hypothetical protein MPH_05967 [Macrophomina phaseolina MS6]
MHSNILLTPLKPQERYSRAARDSQEDDVGNNTVPSLPTNPTYSQASPRYENVSTESKTLLSDAYSDALSQKKKHSWMPRTWHRRWNAISERLPSGWKLGTMGAALLSFLILIVNISITAAFYSKLHRKGKKTSVAPIQTGTCEDIKRSGVIIHLAINIASTLLLGASSYCMQSISAPTREDVDAAHKKGIHLDIGVPSYRNLRFIRRRRLLVWVCLCLSSVPLHLVYNSTFFVSTNNNMYPIYYADESFARGAPYNESFFDEKLYDVDIKGTQSDLVAGRRFQNLTNKDCIEGYAKTLVADRRSVILVVDRPENCSIFKDPKVITSDYQDCGNSSATSLYDMTVYSTGIEPAMTPFVSNWFYWICDQASAYRYDGADLGLNKYDEPPKDLCSDGGWKKQLDADSWIVSGARVRYCYSEKVDHQCQLNVAVNLLWVIVGFNIVKLIITCFLVWSSLINTNPLVTIGDAAASFIDTPDAQTRGMCLYGATEIKRVMREGTPIAQEYRGSPKLWSAGVSKLRWSLASIL